MKLEQYCDECGGTNVSVQGWLEWNKVKQKWEFSSIQEDSYDWFDDCDDQVKTYEREIK